MECTIGFDEATGEALDPVVGLGHSPHSPFADGDEIPEDYQDPDAFEPQSGEDMIVESIHELYPDLDNILDFAIEKHGDEITSLYDEAIDKDDWSTVNNYLEQWSEEFRETQQEPVNYEEVTQELDQLVETEPEGLETAFDLLQQAEQSSDPCESEILQMSASFHRGDISAEDAIQSMLDKYPIDQLINTYNQLNR